MADYKALKADEEYAGTYDDNRGVFTWYPEFLFGLMYEYVKARQTILDIGIGTGLASQPFVKAKLKVSGCDGSDIMLDTCRAKGVTKDLQKLNLTQVPWPYDDESYHHVISTGVFHFIGELGPIFAEAARIIKPGGKFGFITRLPNTMWDRPAEGEGYREITREDGVVIYIHDNLWIKDKLAASGFEIVKELRTLIWSGNDSGEDYIFKAWVAAKTPVT